MRGCLAVFVLLVIPTVVRAEQNGGVELGGGVGYARALHGDLDFGDVAVSGTGRVRVARHVIFEGQVGYWQHRESETFRTNRGEIVQTSTTRRFPSVTASVIAVSDRGGVVPYAGAGVGVFYHISKYEQTATGQFPAFSDSDWRIGLGAELVGGMDVRVATRVKAFGEFRFDVQSFRDPGSSVYRALGVARVVFR